MLTLADVAIAEQMGTGIYTTAWMLLMGVLNYYCQDLPTTWTVGGNV